MNSSVPDGNQPIGDNVTVQIVVPTPVLPNAQYISETVPPGTSEPVNTSFTETVTMKNTGNTTWITGINGYTLNLLTTAQFGETGSPIYAQLNQSSVAPGSNGTFTILMKTQPTAGTYTETWRMNSSVPDGNQPIGDNVTVQIVVPQPQLSDNAQVISLSPTSGTSVAAGSPFTEVVTMKNTGGTTWYGGMYGYTLNRNPQSNDPFQQGSIYYTTLDQSLVAPGSTGTFTMHLKAPASPGTSTETWQMSNPSYKYFGGTVTLTRTVAGTVVTTDGFDYPLGNRGYNGSGNPVSLLEFPGSSLSETNNLYPSNPVANPDRGGTAPASGWYNAQDVGSYLGTLNGVAIGGIHPGEDWNLAGGGDAGQPVYAVANGIVKWIVPAFSTPSTGGWVIVVLHTLPNSQQYYSIYEHVTNDAAVDGTIAGVKNAFSIQEGQSVLRGQLIARIGRPSSFSPHLHFEIRNYVEKPGGGTELPLLHSQRERVLLRRSA